MLSLPKIVRNSRFWILLPPFDSSTPSLNWLYLSDYGSFFLWAETKTRLNVFLLRCTILSTLQNSVAVAKTKIADDKFVIKFPTVAVAPARVRLQNVNLYNAHFHFAEKGQASRLLASFFTLISSVGICPTSCVLHLDWVVLCCTRCKILAQRVFHNVRLGPNCVTALILGPRERRLIDQLRSSAWNKF